MSSTFLLFPVFRLNSVSFTCATLLVYGTPALLVCSIWDVYFVHPPRCGLYIPLFPGLGVHCIRVIPHQDSVRSCPAECCVVKFPLPLVVCSVFPAFPTLLLTILKLLTLLVWDATCVWLTLQGVELPFGITVPSA